MKTETKKKTAGKVVDISVREIIDVPCFITRDDAKKVLRRLRAEFARGNRVRLSFKGVDSAFGQAFDESIAKLYDNRSDDEVRRILTITHLDALDREELEDWIAHRKWKRANPEAHKRNLRVSREFMRAEGWL